MLEQKGQGSVKWFGLNHVVIVKNKDETVWDAGDVIEQGSQERFGRRRLRGLEHTRHPCANRRRNRLQRRDKVRQKACRVAIAFVQRQPCSRLCATGDPLAEE